MFYVRLSYPTWITLFLVRGGLHLRTLTNIDMPSSHLREVRELVLSNEMTEVMHATSKQKPSELLTVCVRLPLCHKKDATRCMCIQSKMTRNWQSCTWPVISKVHEGWRLSSVVEQLNRMCEILSAIARTQTERAGIDEQEMYFVVGPTDFWLAPQNSLATDGQSVFVHIQLALQKGSGSPSPAANNSELLKY